MSNQIYQEKVTSFKAGFRREILDRPSESLARFHVQAGTITRIDIFVDSASTTATVFTIRKNGVDQFPSPGDRITVAAGAVSGSKTGLSITVAAGDTIAFDATEVNSGGFNCPAYFQVSLTVDDGFGALDSLSDVNAPSPTNGDILTWDSTPGEWIAAAPAGAPSVLNDLTDVNAASPSDGQVLTWDSTPGEWVAASPAGGTIGLYSPDIPYTSPNSFDDEFNAGSLDGKWSTYNTPSTPSFPTPNHLKIIPTDSSNLRAHYQTITPASGDIFVMKFHRPIGISQANSFGFYMNFPDVSSTWRVTFMSTISGGGNTTSFAMYWWSSSSAINQQFNSSVTVAGMGGGTFYMKLECYATGKWYWYVSNNGVAWEKIQDSFAAGGSTITPTVLGFSSIGVNTSGGIYLDWIRKQQGNYTGANF